MASPRILKSIKQIKAIDIAQLKKNMTDFKKRPDVVEARKIIVAAPSKASPQASTQEEKENLKVAALHAEVLFKKFRYDVLPDNIRMVFDELNQLDFNRVDITETKYLLGAYANLSLMRDLFKELDFQLSIDADNKVQHIFSLADYLQKKSSITDREWTSAKRKIQGDVLVAEEELVKQQLKLGEKARKEEAKRAAIEISLPSAVLRTSSPRIASNEGSPVTPRAATPTSTPDDSPRSPKAEKFTRQPSLLKLKSLFTDSSRSSSPTVVTNSPPASPKIANNRSSDSVTTPKRFERTASLLGLNKVKKDSDEKKTDLPSPQISPPASAKPIAIPRRDSEKDGELQLRKKQDAGKVTQELDRPKMNP